MKHSLFLCWSGALFYLLFMLVISCGSSQAVTSPTSATDTVGREVIFMPENDLHLEDGFFLSSMSQSEFNSVINKLTNAYSSVVANLGANLKIIGNWRDNTVNAYAYQKGAYWYVDIFGGLARRPELSPDGLALVVCHELGHHLGGFPDYVGEWASSEGQSDYFSTQACAKKIWGGETSNNRRAYENGSYSAVKFCEQSLISDSKVPLCVRTVDASMGLASLLGGGGNFSPLRPDKTEVRRTKTSHPNAQCRLDTYAQGVICAARWYDMVIPQSEYQTSKYTCTRSKGYQEGNRPLCWFKPGN